MKNMNATSYRMVVITARDYMRIENFLKGKVDEINRKIFDCEWLIFQAPEWIQKLNDGAEVERAKSELEYLRSELEQTKKNLNSTQHKNIKYKYVISIA